MPRSTDERQRISAAASLGDIASSTVTDYQRLTVNEALCGQGEMLPVPAAWHVASAGASADQPVRALVTGHRSRGGWQGCDTLAAFGFTGVVSRELGAANAYCTLKALGASGITIHDLDVPEHPETWAVRSSGYFTAAGLRMWAQFSTYVAGSHHPGCGRVIEHSLSVITQRRTQLRLDIEELSDSIQTAFGQLKSGFQPRQVGPSGQSWR